MLHRFEKYIPALSENVQINFMLVSVLLLSRCLYSDKDHVPARM